MGRMMVVGGWLKAEARLVSGWSKFHTYIQALMFMSKEHSQSSSAMTSPSPGQSKAPETLTKKERQRVAKRAAEKAGREDAEAARLLVLAKHKRDLERERIAEQLSHKGPGSTRRNVSGGIVNPGG